MINYTNLCVFLSFQVDRVQASLEIPLHVGHKIQLGSDPFPSDLSPDIIWLVLHPNWLINL